MKFLFRKAGSETEGQVEVLVQPLSTDGPEVILHVDNTAVLLEPDEAAALAAAIIEAKQMARDLP